MPKQDLIPSSTIIARIDRLADIGIALSAERDSERLLEQILLGAIELTNSNAGTLYLVTDDQRLKMVTLRNADLGLAWGGTTGNPIKIDPIPLYKDDGSENRNNIVTYAVLADETINVEDAYTAEGFNFSGTRKMDQQTGYRSKSFLTIPLKNHLNNIIGVLQLINRQQDDSSIVVPFNQADQLLAESLASQAAVTLTNKQLIEEQKQLFDDFIRLIAQAIDEKSPYTGGHCTRVPEISLMIAEAMNNSSYGKFKDFKFNEDEMYELKVASWLHDCGKVATPEYVMDKATKLETIYDRVKEVALRFELIKKDKKIHRLKEKLAEYSSQKVVDELLDNHFKSIENITNDWQFIAEANIGGEFLSDEQKRRIQEIGTNYQWIDQDGKKHPLLNDDEISNLQISRGTLNNEEREIICNHVVITLRMLESLHYPKNLRRVPEIAGSHHERIDGKGYPRKLKGDEMTTQARIVAIADVFEALTAADRPYKKAKPLSESLKILSMMSKEGHIDPDIYKLFIQEKVYENYAKAHLKPNQFDQVDVDSLLK